MRELRDRLAAELSKVVVGHQTTGEILLAALLVGGHVLLQGVPGTAKTLLAWTFAAATGLSFGRIQFTPDMLPADVTGTTVLRDGDLRFRPGPIFVNVLLADEINRTPPKTQAALLEAMGESQVTVDVDTHELPEPFIVVATQNPIEYEGTYPLPEAQLDRFLVRIDMGYPSEADERTMLKLPRSGVDPTGLASVRPVVDAAGIAQHRSALDMINASDEVIEYVSGVIRATRRLPPVALGASPQASVHLLAAARATAAMNARDFVIPDNVSAIAPFVLAHRLILRPEASLDRYTADDAVRAALAETPVPR